MLAYTAPQDYSFTKPIHRFPLLDSLFYSDELLRVAFSREK